MVLKDMFSTTDASATCKMVGLLLANKMLQWCSLLLNKQPGLQQEILLLKQGRVLVLLDSLLLHLAKAQGAQ